MRIFADRGRNISSNLSPNERRIERGRGRAERGFGFRSARAGGGDGGMTVDHRNHASIGGKGENWRLVGRLAWNGRLEQESPWLYAFKT